MCIGEIFDCEGENDCRREHGINHAKALLRAKWQNFARDSHLWISFMNSVLETNVTRKLEKETLNNDNNSLYLSFRKVHKMARLFQYVGATIYMDKYPNFEYKMHNCTVRTTQ